MPPLLRSSIASVSLRRPSFSAGFRTPDKLTRLKAILAANGISNLSALGKLDIRSASGACLIPTPGILKPGAPIESASQIPLQGLKIPAPEIPGRLASEQPLVPFASVGRLTTPVAFRAPNGPAAIPTPIREAYWVADEIVIADGTTVVFTSQCQLLFIVARKVTIGRNVNFTWEPPAFNNDISVIPPPRQPRQNAVPNSESDVIHGTDRVHGKDGSNGDDGIDAPYLQIWSLDITGKPRIFLPGQDGQDGQDGQNGGMGQDGARGISGKVNNTGGVGLFCDRKAGSGGNGATGGNGGDGGNGGNGGNGGRVDFYVPDSVRDILTGNGFHVELSGGRGGRKGEGGRGGRGGNAGGVGKTDRSINPINGDDWCVCGPSANAVNGRDGRDGSNGSDGSDGQPGTTVDVSVRFIDITAAEFDRQLTLPAIISTDKSVVIEGELISISGLNFGSADKVFIGGSAARLAGVSSTSLLTCHIPATSGGNVDLWVQRTDGTKSNIYTLIVKPLIKSITQSSPSTSPRLRPGSTIKISGSGFSSDSRVLIEGVELPDFSFISPTEIHARLIRPFPRTTLTSPSGENASIKVRIPSARARAESNSFPVILDTFRLLILGDSIAWGQGLQEHEKFHTLLENHIRDRAGDMAVYKSIFAHSGAIIGTSDNTTDPPVPGNFGPEVPSSSPTIREQLLASLNGNPTNDTIDLVVIVGGINDADIIQILNPAGPPLPSLLDDCCRIRMKDLLKKTADRLPNAKIIVAGYHLPFSDQSNTILLPLAITAMGLAVAGVPGVVGGLALSAIAEATLKQRCKDFQQISRSSLSVAVAETMTESPQAAGRIFFADPDFLPQHAMFASQSLIFEINPDLSPQDNDVVKNGRIIACDLNAPRGGAFCRTASTGHPNAAGHQRYANAVISRFRAAFPDMA